jgi:hypothetical protein
MLVRAGCLVGIKLPLDGRAPSHRERLYSRSSGIIFASKITFINTQHSMLQFVYAQRRGGYAELYPFALKHTIIANSEGATGNYTPPQKSGQDFAPSQVKNVTMRRFYWQNSWNPRQCFGAQDGMRRKLRGANSSTAGLVYLGLSRPHPCGTLFQTVAVLVRRKSNRRTTPQYELLCDGRANIMHRRRREEILGSPLRGKRKKSRIV